MTELFLFLVITTFFLGAFLVADWLCIVGAIVFNAGIRHGLWRGKEIDIKELIE